MGLAPERVEVLGAMPEYLTGTGFRVTPVVGLVHPPFTLEADKLEVADIFEVPLAFLMNPANHQVRLFAGRRRASFLLMPYAAGASSYFIWGATAGGVAQFLPLPRGVSGTRPARARRAAIT